MELRFATNLTDVLPPDPFVTASQGRAMLRVADLLECVDASLSTANCVKEIHQHFGIRVLEDNILVYCI